MSGVIKRNPVETQTLASFRGPVQNQGILSSFTDPICFFPMDRRKEEERKQKTQKNRDRFQRTKNDYIAATRLFASHVKPPLKYRGGNCPYRKRMTYFRQQLFRQVQHLLGPGDVQ